MILPMESDAARGWTPGKPTVFLGTPANEVLSDVLAGRPMDRILLEMRPAAIFDVTFVRSRAPAANGVSPPEAAPLPAWSTSAPELLFLTQTVMFAPYSVVGDSFRAGHAADPVADGLWVVAQETARTIVGRQAVAALAARDPR